MKPILYFSEASEELEAALTWSAASDPKIVAEFRLVVDEALNRVALGIIVAARFPRTPCREYSLTRFPYSIVYLDDADAIRVVAFTHHKRSRGYWKSRLRP